MNTNYIDDIPADLAQRAFYATSFDPEGRGEREREGYARRLADFRAFLEREMKGQPAERVQAEFDRYREKALKLTIAWLGTHSRLASPAIVGPARFPSARMQKIGDVEHRRLGELLAHDKNARASISRRFGEKLRQPIMGDDPDAIERLEVKLAKCREMQQRMKDANAAIRKAKGDEAKAKESLLALGFSEKCAAVIISASGFPSYELTNNNAEIRRLEKRIRDISARCKREDEEEEGENGVRVEVDQAGNRVRVYFPDKPDANIRSALKSHGFRWSPSSGAWQAYINPRTTAHAKSYLSA